jgi:L-fuconolactonase
MLTDSPPEVPLDPRLPIVDAHHHLWLFPEALLLAMESPGLGLATRMLVPTLRSRPRYLFDEYLADLNSGHNIRASVFVEAYTMYRSDGPAELRSVGEVEFANGVAAMAASGLFGESRACAGIVSGIDLRLGAAVDAVLAAHIQAGGGRLRGVRGNALFDEDATILGAGVGMPHLYQDPAFREGFARLRAFNLTFDALVLEPQLPDLVDLARAFPDTPMILNHAGSPVGIGRHEGKRAARFPIWRESMTLLSRCENVVVKLGGFGIPFPGFRSRLAQPPASSAELAAEWQPYVDTCIETFGPSRCMFEGNFPVDASVGHYSTVWNAFKRLTHGASPTEKTALFSGTAARVYHLEI